MVFACCAVGCHNRQGQHAGRSFYRFPTDPDKRAKWIAAVNRQDWEPTEYSRLCSDHFISGARSNHPLSPDFVPSVFQHTSSPVKRKGQQSLESFQRRQAMKSRKREEESRRSAAQALLDLTSGLNIPVKDLELENTTEADVERTFETSVYAHRLTCPWTIFLLWNLSSKT
ncbi:peroxynitrite isomerase THAP4-like isoform X1 [Neoarius graeffei]|uniref:peroxynitrite isomerase THAP4-like isoform X1 n=1 Tax=Neoarius graeffei TaxID=443677 RepID=UPI00298D5CAB|nr:peroxynitrite isomerase THAP4-like isoform X1 [Neoarius graeffei]